MKTILEYSNVRDMVTSRVIKTESGFSVCLIDDESGNTLPVLYRYDSLQKAAVMAQFLVNV